MEVDGDEQNMEARLIPIHVEVQINSKISDFDEDQIKQQVKDLLAKECLGTGYKKGEIANVDCLKDIVDKIVIDVDVENCPYWEGEQFVHIYQLTEEGPYDETTEEDPESTAFTHWELPSKEFDGLWENLMFEVEIKSHLLEFATTSLLFSKKCVNSNVISWNHVVLLYGPPGTGKTSLSCALAHKLSIRLGDSFKTTQLLEINSHSLFSKWFSESGKLVSKLFSHIHELAEDEESLVCILIDEVESLAAARKASMSGSEPSDSIRVVNALLTQIDRLKTRKNVIILTTSNITEAIDVAFVDRADIRQYIGLPSTLVRKNILKTCVDELFRTNILIGKYGKTQEALLEDCATVTDGLSGRALRKLPFQAHARHIRQPHTTIDQFLHAMIQTAKQEADSLLCK